MGLLQWRWPLLPLLLVLLLLKELLLLLLLELMLLMSGQLVWVDVKGFAGAEGGRRG